MAVYRDSYGNLDMQEFENHLKATTRKEGYMEIVMYAPNPTIQIKDVTSSDKLGMCDLSSIFDLDRLTSTTIPTLEENLWLLNGRFITYQGGTVDGYISNSVSDDNGNFATNPTLQIDLTKPSKIDGFSVILNSAVPTGYPKSIKTYYYDASGTLLTSVTKNIEWEEATEDVDEDGNQIYVKKVLSTLPSVNFDVSQTNVSRVVVEFIQTRFRHRRIRVSTIMFGTTITLTEQQVLNVDYTDKTSYVCDTLPSRVFSFDMNNYDGIYNIDNPENNYVKLNYQTRVRFRNGYNVFGYVYDQDGHVIMDNGQPVVDIEQDGTEIEWDNWKELRLIDVSANADESVTFTAGSLLDAMEDVYPREIYPGDDRTVREIAEDVLKYKGFDLDSIEFSNDGIKKPKYDGETLLPYAQWETTDYDAYLINTVIPEVPCKQVLQLLAFSVGATILIKDNGHIKFANLNIDSPSTFSHNYSWTYHDFESIPAAEQLNTVDTLTDLSLPKYYSYLDRTGEEEFRAPDGSVYPNCTVISTVNLSTINTEITYGDCLAVGCRIADDDTSGASIIYYEVYSKRGIVTLGGLVTGDEAKVEVLGYPIHTKVVQEREVTNNTLVLDTNIMKYDINQYNSAGIVTQSELIKRKYLAWYQKKFKYNITTRGEPLVNAGDYGVIQTQFTQQMPVYILQNHWTFDGTWSGDMEVIALG